MNRRNSKLSPHLPKVVGGAVVVLAGLCTWYVVASLDDPVPTAKKVVQEIKVIRPPPPPPDQPPPPPPPQEEEPVEVPEPQDAPPDPSPSDQPPPGDSLGVDADGSGAGDGFGLVGRKGGRDLLASGGGFGFNLYANLVKNELLERISEEKSIRQGSYTANVRLWIRQDGSIERAALLGTTGNDKRDRQIEAALARLTRLSQAPPANMPQPVSLRIVARA